MFSHDFISFLVLPLQNLYKLVLDTYEKQERNHLYIFIVWFKSSSLESKLFILVWSFASSYELLQKFHNRLLNTSFIIYCLFSLSPITHHPSSSSLILINHFPWHSNPFGPFWNYFGFLEQLCNHFEQLHEPLRDFGHCLHYVSLQW